MIAFSKNVDRAAKACERYETYKAANGGLHPAYKREKLLMDLCAADGVNGNQAIDWDRLELFDDFNFLHDIGGISRHINRGTGVLEDFFVPRSARLS